MKYLMLFEAFKSSNINKALGYLNSKSREEFLKSIRFLVDKFDIEADKITDENIIYKRAKSARKITGKANNDLNLYAFKFWFDSDKNYLGFTTMAGEGEDLNVLPDIDDYNYVGEILPEDVILTQFEQSYIEDNNTDYMNFINSVMSMLEDHLKSMAEDGTIEQSVYDDIFSNNDNLDRLSDEIKDYLVKLNINDSNNEIDDLRYAISGMKAELNISGHKVRGYLYNQGDKVYLIHGNNHLQGSFPGNPDFRKLIPKSEKTKYSWFVYSIEIDKADSDVKSFKYLNNNDKISLNDTTLNFRYANEVPEALFYNILPDTGSRFSITKESYDKAEFAFIIKYDDLKLSTDKREEREKRKSGAQSIMSIEDLNNKVKSENLKRYSKKLSLKYLDLSNPKSLSDLLLRAMGGKYILWVCIFPSYDGIEIYSDKLLNLIKHINILLLLSELKDFSAGNEGTFEIPEFGPGLYVDIDDYIESTKKKASSILEDIYSSNIQERIHNNMTYLKNTELNYGVMDYISSINKLSLDLYNKIKSMDIKNIVKFNMVIKNLMLLSDRRSMSVNRYLVSSANHIINTRPNHDKSELKRAVNHYSSPFLDKDGVDNMEYNINKLKRFVDSI